MGTVPFLGVKRPECGVNNPFTSSTEVKEAVELYLYSPSGHLFPVSGRTLLVYEDITIFFKIFCQCVKANRKYV
jgi:hypothetical protein